MYNKELLKSHPTIFALISWLSLILILVLIILVLYYYDQTLRKQNLVTQYKKINEKILIELEYSDDKITQEQQLLTQHKENKEKIQAELQHEINKNQELTQLFTPYKELDQALQQVAKDAKERKKSEENNDRFPCQTATKDLMERVKDNIQMNNQTVLATAINGKSLKCAEENIKCIAKDPACKKKSCAHQVVGILVEPQTGEIIKLDDFEPLTLDRNWNKLLGSYSSYKKEQLELGGFCRELYHSQNSPSE